MLIEFDEARYIKLGKGGQWNDISIDRGEIHFGFGRVDHELAATGEYDAIRKAQLDAGRKPSAASNDARAIMEFYSLGPKCLWITFAHGHLWWTFAKPEVIWLGGDEEGRDKPEHGQRFRRCTGWSKFDAHGAPLLAESLSTSLTKVAGYQGTFCSVDGSKDYLYQRLNGIKDPLIAQAEAANEALLCITQSAIAKLHQTDFETLADVLFARSGWHRTTALGGTQQFIDMAIEQPATGEQAVVQVKSRANQTTLDAYIKEFDAVGAFARLFFVCHSAQGSLVAQRPDVHVWSGKELAAMALRLGLLTWVLDRIA